MICQKLSLYFFLGFLKKYLPIVAESGELQVTCDHKYNGAYQADVEKKTFGIEVVLPDHSTKNDERIGILLQYLPTNDATDAETKKYLSNFLEDWGLQDAFKQNKIAFAVDGALYTATTKLFTDDNLEPLVSICQPHSFGNLAKRTLDENLTEYWPEGKAEIEVFKIDRSFF